MIAGSVAAHDPKTWEASTEYFFKYKFYMQPSVSFEPPICKMETIFLASVGRDTVKIKILWKGTFITSNIEFCQSALLEITSNCVFK